MGAWHRGIGDEWTRIISGDVFSSIVHPSRERPNDASGHRITWIPGSEFPILGFEDILDELLNSPPTLSDGLDPCPEGEPSKTRILIWFPFPISRGPIQCHSTSNFKIPDFLFLTSHFSFPTSHFPFPVSPFPFPTSPFPLHIRSRDMRCWIIQWCYILHMANWT